MQRILIVMSSNHATLFRKCYEEYERENKVKFEFVIIPSGTKNNMTMIEYVAFKYDLMQKKRHYYNAVRHDIVQKAQNCDKVLFYNLIWDGDFLIDEFVYRSLKGKDCRVTFADPMREISHDFAYWDLFAHIYTCEYDDLIGFAKEHTLNVEFVPGRTKYTVYNYEDIDESSRIYDICFVGLGTSERLRYLELVARYCYENNLRPFFAGHFWHNTHLFSRCIGEYKFRKKHPYLGKYVVNKFIDPEEVFQIYRKSKICLNINTLGHHAFNCRNLDIMCAGSTVLTQREDMSGYDFVEGVHYYACSSPKEMVEMIDELLKDENRLKMCREIARDLVKEKYNYFAGIKKVCNDV